MRITMKQYYLWMMACPKCMMYPEKWVVAVRLYPPKISSNCCKLNAACWSAVGGLPLSLGWIYNALV